ncbi:MAG: class II aldolase/adducin family protein [Woeseiaceae bacterium]|nr:class II aldolase/adducin family protein [Woeseiaceae bacterium]
MSGGGPVADEGYVKYRSLWTCGPAPDAAIVAELDRCRRRLHDAGLIGFDEAQHVGYGNLSRRAGDSTRFVISGTQTGHLPHTGGDHYSLVSDVDIDANTVWCTGPVQASSESMTHAALYRLDAGIGAVVHVHSAPLWERLRGELPTTDASVRYGTPAMAHEFERLWADSEFPTLGVAVMAGHENGIVAIGASIDEATRRTLALTPTR